MRKSLMIASIMSFAAAACGRPYSSDLRFEQAKHPRETSNAQNADSLAQSQYQCYSPPNIDEVYRIAIAPSGVDGTASVSQLRFNGSAWVLSGRPVAVRKAIVPEPEGDSVRFIGEQLVIIVRSYQVATTGHQGRFQAGFQGDLSPGISSETSFEISCDDVSDSVPRQNSSGSVSQTPDSLGVSIGFDNRHQASRPQVAGVYLLVEEQMSPSYVYRHIPCKTEGKASRCETRTVNIQIDESANGDATGEMFILFPSGQRDAYELDCFVRLDGWSCKATKKVSDRPGIPVSN